MEVASVRSSITVSSVIESNERLLCLIISVSGKQTSEVNFWTPQWNTLVGLERTGEPRLARVSTARVCFERVIGSSVQGLFENPQRPSH